MNIHDIFQWFYLNFDRTACNHAMTKHENTNYLGSGRHFEVWGYKDFALCKGERLPQKWSTWMQKVSSLGPQELIPPFELLNDHTIVMPKLQMCQSVTDKGPESRSINRTLREIKLQLCDLQIGTFQNTQFIYDWSDLKPL